jgi:hypothetical protein
VVTTAADMANFLRMQLGKGSVDGNRVVSAHAVRVMHTPPRSVGGGYAMGWFAHPAVAGQPAWLDHNGLLSTFYAEQAIVGATGYGVAVLANAQHTISGLPGLAHRIATRLAGGDPGGGGLGLRFLGYGLLTLCVITLGLRGWRLARTGRWSPRAARPRWLRRILGTLWTVWLLAPAALLVALPFLTTKFTGRVFGYRVLFWSMPDVVGLLALAGVTGAALVVARAGVLLYRRRVRG